MVLRRDEICRTGIDRLWISEAPQEYLNREATIYGEIYSILKKKYFQMHLWISVAFFQLVSCVKHFWYEDVEMCKTFSMLAMQIIKKKMYNFLFYNKILQYLGQESQG